MGEPDGVTAPSIVAGAVDALESGRTHYAPASGEPALREAIARAESATAGRAISAPEVVLGHGATGVLSALILGLVTPGDRVIVPEPTYSLYTDLLAMVGAEAIPVPTTPDGSLDLALIRAQLPGASMIIICNPSNPTGAVFSDDQLGKLFNLVEEFSDILLVSDEAYSEIVFDDEDFTSALTASAIAGRVVKVGTFSKTYAMTGWRLGYAIADSTIASRIDLMQRTLNGSLNTMVQDAAMRALEIDPAIINEMRLTFQRRRDFVISRLQAMDRVSVTVPRGAFYAFPRIESSYSSTELVEAFSAGGVLVRAGSEYGQSGEGHVRISFASDDDTLAEGLRRFESVIAELPD